MCNGGGGMQECATELQKCATNFAQSGNPCGSIDAYQTCLDNSKCPDAAKQASQAGIDQAKKGCAGGGGFDGGSANCAGDLAKCGQDYAKSAQGGDICPGLSKYQSCVNNVQGCPESAIQMSQAALDKIKEQMKGMCGDGGSGGDGGSEAACNACEAEGKGLFAERESKPYDIPVFKKFCKEGFTLVETTAACFKKNNCKVDDSVLSDFKGKIDKICKEGMGPEAYGTLLTTEGSFKTCSGGMTLGQEGPDCDQAAKLAGCAKKEGIIGTKIVEACEVFKTAKCPEMTCEQAQTGAAPSTVPVDGDVTGAAFSAQLSTSIVIAAAAFVGMAH